MFCVTNSILKPVVAGFVAHHSTFRFKSSLCLEPLKTLGVQSEESKIRGTYRERVTRRRRRGTSPSGSIRRDSRRLRVYREQAVNETANLQNVSRELLGSEMYETLQEFSIRNDYLQYLIAVKHP